MSGRRSRRVARTLGAAVNAALGAVLGSAPPRMQVGALCRDRATGHVLLITSRGTGRWIIPKGWPMPGRGLADAALQEAWEEAGVLGDPVQQELGRFDYDKAQAAGLAVPVEVRVFPVWVRSLADDFPEAAERERRWFHPAEAALLVAEPRLRKLLRDLARSETTARAAAGDGGADGTRDDTPVGKSGKGKRQAASGEPDRRGGDPGTGPARLAANMPNAISDGAAIDGEPDAATDDPSDLPTDRPTDRRADDLADDFADRILPALAAVRGAPSAT